MPEPDGRMITCPPEGRHPPVAHRGHQQTPIPLLRQVSLSHPGVALVAYVLTGIAPYRHQIRALTYARRWMYRNAAEEDWPVTTDESKRVGTPSTDRTVFGCR